MPEISRFYGIVVRMYPHFHVQYGEFRASVFIESLEVFEGDLPLRARKLVNEWAGAHQQELRDNWRRAQAHEPVLSIDPLA